MSEKLYQTIPLLRDLVTVNDGDEENVKPVVPLDDFLRTLKSLHEKNDKAIRNFNIIRELESKPHGIIQGENKKFFTTSKVLQFVFNNKANFACCAEAVNKIQIVLYGGCAESVWRIYSQVAEHFFKSSEDDIINRIDIPEVPTLHKEYKEYFNERDWRKICLFEFHFNKEYDVSSTSYLEEMALRAQFLKSCSDVNILSESVYNQCKALINNRLKRQAASELEEGILLSTPALHAPLMLETDILTQIVDFSNQIGDVAVLDCTPGICTHAKGLHIFAELTSGHAPLSAEDANNLSLLIQKCLTSHEVNVCEVVFLAPKTLQQYSEGQNAKQRFKLRDDFYLFRLNKCVETISRPSAAGIEVSQTEGKCTACFQTNLNPALSLDNFNILTEWHLDVPLVCQVMLETFLNKESLRKSKDNLVTIKPKLVKLYGIFDALLNITNRCYSGMLQSVNTTELSINYHSIKTVFAVTSSSDASRSLTSAEKDLKERSDTDRCYFNTYLKKYALEYESWAGMQ